MDLNKKPKSVLVMYFFSIVFALVAIAFMIWHISAMSARSDIRANGQRTTATALSRSKVKFVTPSGEYQGNPIVGPQQGTLKKYDSVYIYYDKNDPGKFVLEQDDSPYNITMWIVVVKLVGASAVLAYLGYRKQRKLAIKSDLVSTK